MRRAYVIASLGLIALHPLLPDAGLGITLVATLAGALACLVVGRRAVEPGRRLPWTLLLWALAVLAASNAILHAPGDRLVALGWLFDALGNLLALAAALAVILRRGARDLGGIIDAVVIAFAAGIVLWAVLPHRLSGDIGFTAQVDLFVVVFALTGVLGALLRLARTAANPGSALWWLLTAIGLAITGNVVAALGGGASAPDKIADMMFMGAFTALGLFGLDPAGPRLTDSQAIAHAERLSNARLALLGVAVAIVPAVFGIRLLASGNPTGLVLTVQGAFVSALVMVRIGILAAQRAHAEQALQHQATHDPLTSLPNRRELVSRLRAEMSRGNRCAVLYCDLDDFKSINDQFGHDVGDQLLIDVAERLRECLDDRHMVSRFGGDEFVVLLLNASDSEAGAVQECIEQTLHRPFSALDGATLAVSVGVAHADGERDPDQLIRIADHAMYEAKARHRRTGS